MSSFVERLKELIAETNLTVKEFSKKVGIFYTIIFRWYNGSIPSLKNLMTLAKYFNCSLDFLLGKTLQFSTLSKNDADPFSVVIKKLLKKKNITIYRLSKDLNISTDKIYKWLKDESMPKVITLLKLADYFDCTFDEIVGLESFENNNK